MKTIYLIRHAQSVVNAGDDTEVVTYANADIPITELGQQQAEQLAIWLMEHVENVKEIFVSPYLRTQQTAAPYVQKMQLLPTVLDDLHEFNYLSLSKIKGKTFQELRNQAQCYWATNDVNFREDENCDSFASFFNQINRIREYFLEKTDGVYVVYGHGFWIGVLLWQLLGRYSDELDMQKFREFELLIRPKNTDVFVWQIDAHIESIAKIRK